MAYTNDKNLLNFNDLQYRNKILYRGVNDSIRCINECFHGLNYFNKSFVDILQRVVRNDKSLLLKFFYFLSPLHFHLVFLLLYVSTFHLFTTIDLADVYLEYTYILDYKVFFNSITKSFYGYNLFQFIKLIE